MRDKGVRKDVGFSWVDAGDIRGPLHLFSSDDTSHVQTKEIYSMAQFLDSEMKSELVKCPNGYWFLFFFSVLVFVCLIRDIDKGQVTFSFRGYCILLQISRWLLKKEVKSFMVFILPKKGWF